MATITLALELNDGEPIHISAAADATEEEVQHLLENGNES